MVLTSSGKKQISAVITTVEVRPKPNQITTSGASTTSGIVWLPISTGITERRASPEASSRIEMAKAKTTETAKPMSTSRSVGSVLSQSEARSAQPALSTRDSDGSTSFPSEPLWA